MKNITKSIIALFAILAFSCTQDDVQDRPVIVGTDAPVLTAPQADQIYVFAPENASQLAERFTWSPASFDGNVEIVYAVQMDKKGGDFSAPQTLGSVVAQNQVAVTVEVMNTAALKLKATPFAENNFDIRVVATTGVATTIISAVTPIVITPYTTEAPRLWVPGGYQLASGYTKDFDPATAPQLAAAAYGKTAFEGYVYFKTAQDGAADGQGFKFTTQADWAGTNYGVGATPGKIDPKGGNLSIAAGYYLLSVDTKADILSYSATAITTMGIVGNGTPGGWDASTPMTYDQVTKKWTVTAVLTAQSAPSNGMKFRANNAWTINYGDTGNDGVLDFDGTNIGTSAGTYLITLDLSNPRHYTYTMVKQ